jgi:hypothetical protein
MIERAYGVADTGSREPSAREGLDEAPEGTAERPVHDRLRPSSATPIDRLT